MNYIVEPKEGYSLIVISNKLHAMNIPHVIAEDKEGNNIIRAELSFDEVCDLKNMAYCIHESNHDT